MFYIEKEIKGIFEYVNMSGGRTMGFLDRLMGKKKVTLDKVTLDTVIEQNIDVDASDLDGEKVMMNLDKGKYFMLNEVGSRIWDLTESPKSISKIVETLLTEYEIERDICKETVLQYVEKLLDAEIVTLTR